MNILRCGVVLFLLLAAMPVRAGDNGSMTTGTITVDRVGTVPYTLPQGKPGDVVILFSDAPNAADSKMAVQKLAGLGAVVAVVDTAAYTAMLRADKAECEWLSSDIEGLNHALQRKLAFPDFRLPVLASIGKGGVLVYGLLAEAPSYSFAGGVSFGFNDIAIDGVNICGVGIDKIKKDNLPAVDVNQPWLVQPVVGNEEVSDWLDDVDKAELVPVDAHTAMPDQLANLVKPLLAGAIAKNPNSLADLPLIELPAQKPQPYVAIVWSGDGGWRDLDRTLGQVLAANGVPVVGVDSLLYFWQPKRPEVVAHDLDRIMDHYRQVWKTDKFVLIGYSFGADIMPFAYNRLSAENRAHVVEVSLLGLARDTRFEISVSEYFSDSASDETRQVEPELAKMPAKLVQCFYGEDEAADSACVLPAAAKDEVVKTEGGHHFGEDYDALAQLIMRGVAKRMGGK